MRIIALDLGTKTCGFAITDDNRTISNPLENYEYSKNDILQVLNRLRYWLKTYEKEVDTILLGYPTNTIGSKTPMTLYVEKFLEKLKESFSEFNIVLFDERFSTLQGSEMLMDLGIKASARKKMKDKMAAFVILQNYLETIKK